MCAAEKYFATREKPPVDQTGGLKGWNATEITGSGTVDQETLNRQIKEQNETMLRQTKTSVSDFLCVGVRAIFLRTFPLRSMEHGFPLRNEPGWHMLECGYSDVCRFTIPPFCKILFLAMV